MIASVNLGLSPLIEGDVNVYASRSNLSPILRAANIDGETVISPDVTDLDPIFNNRDAPYFELNANSPLEGNLNQNGLYPQNSGSISLGYNKDYKSCFAQVIPMHISGTVTATDCSIDTLANGAIDIFIVGGVPPYNFNWETQDGTGLITQDENQTGLSVGNYKLKVTDANGCMETKYFEVVELNPQGCLVNCSRWYDSITSC